MRCPMVSIAWSPLLQWFNEPDLLHYKHVFGSLIGLTQGKPPTSTDDKMVDNESW